MSTDLSQNRRLNEWYERRIGQPGTDDEVTGYWIFVLGLLLGILGIFMVIISEPASALRGWGIVAGAIALALLVAGPLVRLPLDQYASILIIVGLFVSIAGVLWFTIEYPANWRPQSSPIIAVYAVGLLIMAVGGVFAPLLMTRSEAEASQLRLDLADAIADETDLAGVVDDLRAALEDADADEDDLAREIDRLQSELTDSTADEADLSAQLRTLRTSQSRFELYEDTGGQWRWRLRHRNGNMIANGGEGYTRKHNAQKGIAGVRRDALGAELLLIESEDQLPAAEETFEPVEEVESQAAFEVYEDNAGEHRFRLRHDNGNVLCDSGEGYDSRSNLTRAIDRLREYVGPAAYLRFDPTGFEIYEDAAGQYRWRLVHRNGNVLADGGQGYSRYHDARRAVDRLRENLDDYEFEVYEDAAGEFRWRLQSSNDRIVADSGEGYNDRDGAETAVERVEKYAPDADALDVGPAAFEIYEDAGGASRWRLRHRNGNILADSGQGYDDRSGARDGIESVKRNGPNAEIEDV
ncbi:hypothetical protein HLRTI_001603 [Halorhabdus tiamatea SARL4B]|uniref:Conserved hypothetical membrane protein (DUF1508) n=1 Tax=Halorhabdus tiamatea SARL4B TaxID=1033806 RepID=F7PLZ2_9EURY|nr:DUF1508 domain-containing protein [Halorhabdus tiamatea]ERJ06398.1 hypothetical protein HLRTI_001603 [Halorhabdus tiamatea SARL4B]CCQ34568.1 conserved hypothetical membrane protein (DUF1508) [Halorhabdus tiamatea SARL4B]